MKRQNIVHASLAALAFTAAACAGPNGSSQLAPGAYVPGTVQTGAPTAPPTFAPTPPAPQATPSPSATATPFSNASPAPRPTSSAVPSPTASPTSPPAATPTPVPTPLTCANSGRGPLTLTPNTVAFTATGQQQNASIGDPGFSGAFTIVSSNTSVATVALPSRSVAQISALAAGTATITVSDGLCSATINVGVTTTTGTIQ